MHGLMDLSHLLPSDFSICRLEGFSLSENIWRAKIPLTEEDLFAIYSYDGERMKADVVDGEGEKFSLFYLTNPGPFSSKIREEVENILSSMIYSLSPKEEKVRDRVISLFLDKYGIEGEMPWSDDNTSIVFRSNKNKKWIGIMMDIPPSKLNLHGEENVDVINLKHTQSKIPSLIDNRYIFPAWHMNKNTWITVLLSSDLDWDFFSSLVEESRRLVEK